MSTCNYPNCKRKLTPWKGVYPQYRPGGMVFVCGTHDKILGRQNLMRLAGMSHDDAIAFDTYCRITRDEADPVSWEDWQAAQ